MLVGAVFKSSYVTYLVALAMSADAWDFVPTCLRRFIKRTPRAHGRCKCISCVPDPRVDDVPPKDEPMPPKAEPEPAVAATAPSDVRAPVKAEYPSKSRVLSEAAELDASLYPPTQSAKFYDALYALRTAEPRVSAAERHDQLCSAMARANIAFRCAKAEFEACTLDDESAVRRKELHRMMDEADAAFLSATAEYEAFEASGKK
jgi:hypothetical protein